VIRQSEPLTTDHGKTCNDFLALIVDADAAHMMSAAIADVTPDERPQPVCLPDLVAVEVRPLWLPTPSVFRGQTTVDIDADRSSVVLRDRGRGRTTLGDPVRPRYFTTIVPVWAWLFTPEMCTVYSYVPAFSNFTFPSLPPT
jgi:hypothetical protein